MPSLAKGTCSDRQWRGAVHHNGALMDYVEAKYSTIAVTQLRYEVMAAAGASKAGTTGVAWIMDY